MKREIKFRVWDNVDYMSNTCSLEDIQSGFIEFTKECTVMQFTGLLDKNGKEIYEGDIIDIVEVGRAEVVFQAGAFMARWIDDPEAMLDCAGFRCKNGHKWTSEIIGNVYENPELITK